ncbi:MAG: hypothetical protein AAFR58_14195 [Cyanobacteria bacterium J06627_28]
MLVREELTPEQAKEIEALRQAMMRTWWWISLGLWMTVGAASLWWVRSDLQEINEYFTWAAVRYMLYYEKVAAMGLGLCIGLSFALLLSESRQILWGISAGEEARLLRTLHKIHAQGPSHPQWKIVRPEIVRPEIVQPEED